jgi:transposase
VPAAKRTRLYVPLLLLVSAGTLIFSREGKLSRGIPSIGPIRAALIIAILQTPYRFRTKRQLWSYIGLGIETYSSADHRSVEGKLQRSKKPISIRGLNRHHNHDLKNLFKSAATLAAAKPGHPK